MSYSSIHGLYTCKTCGYTQLDTYGQILQLMEENPTLNKAEIAMMLGISIREINLYIKDGALVNPKSDLS